MKKSITMVVMVLLIGMFIMPINAQEAQEVQEAQETQVAQVAQEKKGGIGPCLISFFIGPRVALEMNEGKPIQTMEIIGFLIPCIRMFSGWSANGLSGCCASTCLGPRVGTQLKERKVRGMEYLGLIYIGRIITAVEAMGGKTMTEIEAKENLKR